MKRFAHCVLALLLYASPLTVTAQLQLLKDVDHSEKPTINEYSSLTTATKFMNFVSNGEGKGTDLWKSDGTARGTILVKDISRGSANPQHLVNFNSTLFFVATSPTGYELWKSDGTSANTVLVRDIIVGPKSSKPAELTVSNNKLFFLALHPQAGRELWISDGTTSGSQLLKDILPGSQTSGPDNLIHANGKLMFTANDGVHGDELCASNGTATGTQMVKDMKAVAGERRSVGVYTHGGMPVEHLDNIGADSRPVRLGSGWQKGHYIIKVQAGDRMDTYHVVKE